MWIVAALTTMLSNDGRRTDTYAFLEDVTDCLWSWIQERGSALEVSSQEELKAWSTDFLTLMLDWCDVLKRDPGYIYSIHFDILSKNNWFRWFFDAKVPQLVIRFGDLELRTRSSLGWTWQDNIVAVDEERDFAYVVQQGYLQCYHAKANLLVAEALLGDVVCERSTLAPDKSALALLVCHPPKLDQHTTGHVANLRRGLQLSTLNTKGAMMAWGLENEADRDETRALSAILFIRPLRRDVLVVRLDYQGVSRTNLLGSLPGLSSFLLRSFEADIMWVVDDTDCLAFSTDSSSLATPIELVSLGDEVPESKAFFLKSPHYRSSKMVGNLKTFAMIRDRRFIELWDVETRSVRHTAQVPGVGHILSISYSARFLLVLRLQTPGTSTKARDLKNGRIRPQRGNVYIYDYRNNSWLDLLKLEPPRSKQANSWAFHLAPVKARFSAESSLTMRVLVFAPDGWSVARNIWSAAGLRDRSMQAGHPHLFIFEGQQQHQQQQQKSGNGAFGAATLRHMIPMPPIGVQDVDREFPKVLDWSDRLDSALVSLGGKMERLSAAGLEDLALKWNETTEERGCEETISRPEASGVFVTRERQTLYRLQLIRQAETKALNAIFDVEIDRVS